MSNMSQLRNEHKLGGNCGMRAVLKKWRCIAKWHKKNRIEIIETVQWVAIVLSVIALLNN